MILLDLERAILTLQRAPVARNKEIEEYIGQESARGATDDAPPELQRAE